MIGGRGIIATIGNAKWFYTFGYMEGDERKKICCFID